MLLPHHFNSHEQEKGPFFPVGPRSHPLLLQHLLKHYLHRPQHCRAFETERELPAMPARPGTRRSQWKTAVNSKCKPGLEICVWCHQNQLPSSITCSFPSSALSFPCPSPRARAGCSRLDHKYGPHYNVPNSFGFQTILSIPMNICASTDWAKTQRKSEEARKERWGGVGTTSSLGKQSTERALGSKPCQKLEPRQDVCFFFQMTRLLLLLLSLL